VVTLGVVSEEVKNGLLASVDVALNPMTSGSGSNLKILEYFATGVPVVSTSFGGRGTSARGWEHFVESEVQDFSQTIDRVLDNEYPRLDTMVKSARELVEREYDWKDIGQKFLERVLELTGTRASKPRPD
jgi:glycosyltransferase involved in cell wall biosynthesis